MKQDFEYNVLKIQEKIEERLKEIESESLLNGRSLVLMSVEKFNQSVLVIKNPESIVLQKQPNSGRIIACWYENGVIKHEELKQPLNNWFPHDQFPSRIGIESAVNLTDTNVVKETISKLALYESHWSDSIPLPLRNFFKQIGLFFRVIFQTTTPSSVDIPEFELNKHTHINRHFIDSDIMDVLKWYKQK